LCAGAGGGGGCHVYRRAIPYRQVFPPQSGLSRARSPVDVSFPSPSHHFPLSPAPRTISLHSCLARHLSDELLLSGVQYPWPTNHLPFLARSLTLSLSLRPPNLSLALSLFLSRSLPVSGSCYPTSSTPPSSPITSRRISRWLLADRGATEGLREKEGKGARRRKRKLGGELVVTEECGGVRQSGRGGAGRRTRAGRGAREVEHE